MFFILSKIFQLVWIPFTWIVLLVVAYYLATTRKWKKRWTYLGWCVAIIFSNPWLYNQVMLAWHVQPTAIKNLPNTEAVILLGGMSGYDSDKKGYFLGNSDRFIQTVQLYHTKKANKILIAGGTSDMSGKNPPESWFLDTAFQQSGIPQKDIIIETSSRNTEENIQNIQKITDSLQLNSPFLLVTSSWHMPRALALCKKNQLEVIPVPCDYKVFPNKQTEWRDFIPDISLLIEWRTILKEWLGMLVYKITGRI